MARSLEQLQKQYNSIAKKNAFKQRPQGGPRGRGMMGGKPKSAKKTIARLLTYMRGFRLRFALVLTCMLLTTVTSLVGGYLLAPIINKLTSVVTPDKKLNPSVFEKIADKVINNLAGKFFPGGETMKYVLMALILLGSIYCIGVITTYVQARLMLSISQGMIERIRNDLFAKLQKLPVRFFDSRQTGEIMSRFTNDIDNIDVMINNSFTQIVSGAVTLVGTFIFMVTTSWILTLVTVAFIPVLLFGGFTIGKLSRKYYAAQQSALGAVNGYIEETVTGQKVVKVFNHEECCVEEFSALNNDMRDKQFKAQFWGGVTGPIMGNTSQISYAVTVGIGGILMIFGKITVGGLTVFAQYSRQFAMPINMLSQQMATFFSALAGAERVFEVMDEVPEAPDAENADPMTNMKGHVVMEHVTFGYNPDKIVLKDINLYAKPGQKIAFVGSTGAGKTTITNLLNRFYDVDQGTITIDGVNVRDIKRDVLRKNIAMVLQDTHLFSGTVMENIRYGRLDATDDEVIAAAKTASAHSFIMRLSDGYNTMLDGDGANLSQGQRQLLNIARAALSKAPILVLDEATSSVDTRTERHIEHGMDRLMKDRTTFVIAHRLSTVRNANAIMVLEHGEIIERGDHDDLLEQKGRYYELYTGVKELD
ncbi:MAG: ABC transporter ATP-binding protein [Lachnospiraceae bacterium]|nr:ABC transporter ATP-binding protein [Lachnospiraceae bacterium]MBR7021245.1 ABC transporter ATP-binding protein [Lachnospiraceae bacterium]